MSSQIVSLIDAEISTLLQVRKLISGTNLNAIVTKVATLESPKVRHAMSAEGRAKIAAAQKKRWALVKKAAK